MNLPPVALLLVTLAASVAVAFQSDDPPSQVALSPQANKCDWDNPCAGGTCGGDCDVSTEQGTFVYGPEGQCTVEIKIKVVCTGPPQTTCNDTQTVDCNSGDPITIICDGCKFTVDPGGAGGSTCQNASWGSMGSAPGSRCGCFSVTCSTP